MGARSLATTLGPGVITGAADDDPSGISTYTVAGAAHGYQLLWTSLVTLPMNIAVQTLCARIGLVTGRGLASVIAQHYGRRWLYPVVTLLFVANVVNIGADIGAIAAAVELVADIPDAWLLAPLGAGIALVEVVVPYAQFARVLRLLTLAVLAYVLGAFVAGPDWGAALRGTLLPRLSLDREMLATVVAILGTTISPYLFFWQTSEEVEEEESRGIEPERVSRRVMRTILRGADVDVSAGMVLANVGFYFVVLTAAATLHAAGQRDVETAAEAAAALEPLAGDAASLLFALGIIGTGLLAVPVLAGSMAYAAAELFSWPEGLGRSFRQAPQFYGVIALATLLGIALDFSGVPAIRALYLAAILNGLIAPILLVFVMTVAGDRRVMGGFLPGVRLRLLGWLTTLVMAGAALALLGTLA
jgi:NRAMP (natural resistance-associated macrophage protein)-like metal ion transporter